MTYIELNKETIEASHICCGFSDKKIKDSYQLKKDWMIEGFDWCLCPVIKISVDFSK